MDWNQLLIYPRVGLLSLLRRGMPARFYAVIRSEVGSMISSDCRTGGNQGLVPYPVMER